MRLRTHAGHLATNLSLNMDQHQLRLYTNIARTISTQLTAATDTEANRRMSGEDMRHVFMSSLQSDDTEQSRKKVPPTATKLHRRRRWRPHSQLKLNISRARPTSTAGVIHGKFYTHLKCP